MAKKKKGLSSKRDETASLRESISALLELCCAGVPPFNTEDTRRSLIEVLRSLKSLHVKAKNNTFTWQQEEDYHWLCSLEDTACKVRDACQEFLEYLVFEKEEICSINQSIEGLQSVNELPDHVQHMVVETIVAARSLVSSYRQQVRHEEMLVNDILEYLDKLYMNDDIDSNDVKIQQWIDCLGQRLLVDAPSLLVQSLDRLAGPTLPGSITDKMKTIEVDFDTAKYPEEMDRPKKLRSKLVSAETLQGAADLFLLHDAIDDGDITFMLAIGPQGSGKTYLCDEIEKKASASAIHVIRPQLPLDMLGNSVGNMEDFLVSILAPTTELHKKVMIILDNMEHLLGKNYSGPSTGRTGTSPSIDETEYHSMARSRCCFLSVLDSILNCSKVSCQNQHFLIIGTAASRLHHVIGRADKEFLISPPTDDERRQIIENCCNIPDWNDPTNDPISLELDTVIAQLVTNTVGWSVGEIAQSCRRAIMACTASASRQSTPLIHSKLHVLNMMKDEIQAMHPESLRLSMIADFVDMKVLTSKQLLNTNQASPRLPLFGDNAQEAWKSLQSLIVTPLCQSSALDDILYSGDVKEAGKVICAGVLLTGEPGCGKTELAYHCARMAASILPSITLIDVVSTSLVHKEVGGSERAIQRLFASARAAAPCILLMDRIETVASPRGHDTTTEGTMDRLLSTMLTELDGVTSESVPGNTSSSRGRIAIIGVTQAEEWIDPSLRRPGRLEKAIRLGKPDRETRKQIALKHLSSLTGPEFLDGDTALRYDELATLVSENSPNLSASDVIGICNEAWMTRLREIINNTKDGKSSFENASTALRQDHFPSWLQKRAESPAS